MTTHPMPEDDYQTIFRQNVLRSIQAVLVRQQREPTLGLTTAVRLRIFTVLDYALRLDEAWPLLGELLRVLGPKFNLGGYWVQWLPYLERGITASVTHQDQKTAAALSCDLGLLYQRLGKLDLAQTHLTNACTVARAEQETAILGLALQQLAEVERLRRRYHECAALLAEASALFAPNALAQAYGHLVAGKAAFDQYDHTTATAAFTEAMTLWQSEGNLGRVALCIQNLGRVAVARDEARTAIPLYEQAIALLMTVEDRSNLPVVQINLGNVYLGNREYEQALSLYRDAEVTAQSMNDDRTLAIIYNNLGVVYTALKEWFDAEANLTRSLLLYRQIDDKKSWISTKGNLGIVYLEQARYPQAKQIFQEALTDLQTTTHDAEYERLWQELSKYLAQAQERSQ